MRKTVLIIIGLAYLLIALYGLAPQSQSIFFPSRSYNLFLAIMAVLALGAADLGGAERTWFDFAFALILIVLTVIDAVNLLFSGGGTLAGLLFNGLTAVILLAFGIRPRRHQSA